jgi:Outer membrane protein beta-barrel domain
MSKFKVFLSIIILSPLFVMAQYKPKFFEIGPKVGFNVSGLGTLDTISFKKKISANYQIGIFTRLNVGKFSLQPEFIYQGKGASISKPIQGKFSYKYLSTPILFGFTPIKGVYFETGPEFSWALNKNYKPQGLTVYGPNVSTDKSWIVGARVNMLDMLSLVSINVRYTHGLTNQSISKIGNTPVDFRNRTFQLSATYAFSEYYLWKRKHDAKKKR